MTAPPETQVLDALTAAASSLAVGEVLDADLHAMANEHPRLAHRLGLEICEGVWTLARQPRWRLAWLREEAFAQWHTLFHAAFGHTMSAALFAWKYRHARPLGVGVWSDKQLVAFYGGMPRKVLNNGAPALAVQIGDVMVEPSQRGILTRSGPFQMAAATYLELCIGHGRAHLLGFGFPSDKAFRVAQKQGLYEAVDSLVRLHWPAAAGDVPWHCEVVALSNANVAGVDTLWRGMAGALKTSIVGLRDAQYVRERYLEHPDKPYDCLLVRRRLTGTPLGLVVLRNRGPEGMEIVDVVATPGRFAMLIGVARQTAMTRQVADVSAWITRSHAHWLRTPGATESPLNITIPCNVWSSGPAVADVQGRWWLMAGDTDFR